MSFLPGMFPYIAQTGAAAPTTLSFVTSAISTGDTITVPASAAAGDILVLFDYAWNSSPVPTEVRPSGWNLATPSFSQDAGSNDARAVISYVECGAGVPGTNVTGMTGTQIEKIMLVFRPDNPVSAITPGGWSGDMISTNPAVQVVTASGQAVPLIVFGFAACRASTASFAVASPAFDATVSETSTNDAIAGYKIYNSSPADHSVDMGDLGNANALASGYLRVS